MNPRWMFVTNPVEAAYVGVVYFQNVYFLELRVHRLFRPVQYLQYASYCWSQHRQRCQKAHRTCNKGSISSTTSNQICLCNDLLRAPLTPTPLTLGKVSLVQGAYKEMSSWFTKVMKCWITYFVGDGGGICGTNYLKTILFCYSEMYHLLKRKSTDSKLAR